MPRSPHITRLLPPQTSKGLTSSSSVRALFQSASHLLTPLLTPSLQAGGELCSQKRRGPNSQDLRMDLIQRPSLHVKTENFQTKSNSEYYLSLRGTRNRLFRGYLLSPSPNEGEEMLEKGHNKESEIEVLKIYHSSQHQIKVKRLSHLAQGWRVCSRKSHCSIFTTLQIQEIQILEKQLGRRKKTITLIEKFSL